MFVNSGTTPSHIKTGLVDSSYCFIVLMYKVASKLVLDTN